MKSVDSKKLPNQDQLLADFEKLHFLKAVFPDWISEDPFLLNQLKDSIESAIDANADLDSSIESFKEVALDLGNFESQTLSNLHATIILDFSQSPWSPLWARNEIVSQLKKFAGTPNIFIYVKGLKKALNPNGSYFTKAKISDFQNAIAFMDQLVSRWSVPSSQVYLLYQ